jgi:sugar/nucleoside kinase (ribokinase family)
MPRPEFDIFGLGTIAVDDTLYVDSYPPPDRKVRINREGRNVGGQIATALATACRLGAHCAYGAILGDDELSGAAWKALETAGVDCRFVRYAPGAGPIHSIIILDEKAGTRNIFFDVSRAAHVPANQISPAMMGSTRLFLTDQFGHDTAILAARCARQMGVAVVMDLEWPDAPRVDEMMPLADHLLVPRDFAAACTGMSIPWQAAEELHRRCPRACTAVTCGPEGCYYIQTFGAVGDVQHLLAPRVESLETTGCGDVFHGAYAAALAGGRDILECLRFASAAAAVFATRPSGWQHLPTTTDVNRLMSTTY